MCTIKLCFKYQVRSYFEKVVDVIKKKAFLSNQFIFTIGIWTDACVLFVIFPLKIILGTVFLKIMVPKKMVC